ncbi:hypothetical protein BUALT_Bualt13G0068600 [Buddleja alternifolia]|uniref:BHLH domain-containing protein n=1 Tax=Buddleja alternifolia TaxID=168488 RepID=A0AAV6WQT3_9LAMI|nr:hypothetical protein BUALT_Bualt13G0068600 [Buddleja alternifolia]
MDRAHDEPGLIIPLQEYVSDFGLIDFMDDANFDQFIDLIRGENAPEPILNFNSHEVFDYDQQKIGGGCLDNSQFFAPAPQEDHNQLFGYEVGTNHVANISPDISALNGSYPNDVGEKDYDDDDDDGDTMDGEGSSGTTTHTPKKKKSDKADRSRTLISERKRRGRMKEKLYALRALVPYITKMDKASIVGDAVLYVQDLQMQAKKLKSEIAGLESSLAGGNKYQGRTTQNANKMNATSFYPMIKKILKMDLFQVEERGFYVKIVSKKGKGVAALLYKALDSLTSFKVQSSNLATSAENFVLTFTLHIKEIDVDLSLPNLKLWIASVFLNQGFDFETSTSA